MIRRNGSRRPIVCERAAGKGLAPGTLFYIDEFASEELRSKVRSKERKSRTMEEVFEYLSDMYGRVFRVERIERDADGQQPNYCRYCVFFRACEALGSEVEKIIPDCEHLDTETHSGIEKTYFKEYEP